MFEGIGRPRWIAIRNDAGATISAFGIVRVTGSATVDGQTVLTVGKPNATSTAVIMINGPADIGAGKYGQATAGPAFALYDDAESPSLGERWGPSDGSWELEQDAPGAIVIGAPTSGRVLVRLTTLARSYACLSGDGSQAITRTFAKLTILDETPVDASGLTVSTVNQNVTVLRDGAYQVQFFGSAEATVTVDTPDTCRPEVALYVNGSRYAATVGGTTRLTSGTNRSIAFSCIADCVGGDVLDIRAAITGNESQQITITGGPTGGTFTLTFAGQTTAGIAYNASAATVQAALEALGAIEVGDVTCTGGPLPSIAVNVEFTGNFVELDMATMTADSAGLTGGSSPTVVISTPSPSSDTLTFDQATWTIDGLNGAE
jgi:hypothetical protein